METMARTMSWPCVVGTASCWPTSTLAPLALIAVMLSLAGSDPVARSAGCEHRSGREVACCDDHRDPLGRGLKDGGADGAAEHDEGDSEPDLPRTTTVGAGGETESGTALR